MTTTAGQPATNLGDIVRATRTSLNYRVYRGVGKLGKFVKIGQKMIGAKTVSDFNENQILNVASREVNGPQIPIEAADIKYDGTLIYAPVAELLQIKFCSGMNIYLKKAYGNPSKTKL